MGYELEKLKRTYGVSSATAPAYSGTAPARPGSGATTAQVDKYNREMMKYEADQRAFKQYQSDYGRRVNAGSIYTQGQFQPATTAQPPALSTLAEQNFPRQPTVYPTSTAQTFENQLAVPSYGTLPAASAGLSAARAGDGQAKFYQDIKEYRKTHTPVETMRQFSATPYDLAVARNWMQPPPAGAASATGSAPGAASTNLNIFNPFNMTAEQIANIRRFSGVNYAQGGPVRMQEGGFMDNQYIMAPQETPSVEDELRKKLMMYKAISDEALGQSSYAGQISEARRAAKEQQEQLLKSLEEAGAEKGTSPEKWFRLAAALTQPTKTGTFGETLGNVAESMAESAKSGREREMARRQLALEAQKIRAGAAKEELGSLLEQSKEETGARRALLGDALKSILEEPVEAKKFEIQTRQLDVNERRAAAAEAAAQAALQQAAAAQARADAALNAPTPEEREEQKGRGKLNLSFPKESAALELGTHGLQSQINTIDKLLSEKEGLSGITGVQGAIYQNLPDPLKAMSGPRAKAFSLYTQISNRSILDELAKMRMESPTGGALGQVTEREEEMLRRAASAMDLAKNTEDFVKAAEAYKDNLEFVKKNMQRRFFDSYAYKPETELKTVTERLRDVEATGARAPKAASQQQEALDWANANPDDPRSAQIKQRLGVQ